MRRRLIISIVSLIIIALVIAVYLFFGGRAEVSDSPGWTQLASMPTPRSEMPAAVIDGLIYVPGGFGGTDILEVYDPASDTWHSRAPLPEGRHHHMAASYDGKLYMFGGAASLTSWAPTSTVWAYDPASDSWEARADMPEPRLAGAAVTLDDSIYIVGGVGSSRSLMRYDPAADTWQVLAGLNTPTEHNAAAAYAGEIWALGGRWQGSGELTAVEIYNPGTQAWRDGPDMQDWRAGFGAAVVDDQIIVAGGEVIMNARFTRDQVEVYDSESGTWQAADPLPAPLHGVPAVNVDDAFYILGGSSQAGGIQNQGFVFRYNP